jgi:ABC-type bacteriocin/lantibiotic exporter with double-glycine peptidase domain
VGYTLDMIKIKPFKQSRGYCGPACMKMVLSFYRIEMTETKIAKETNTTRDGGCKEEDMVRIAKNLVWTHI